MPPSQRTCGTMPLHRHLAATDASYPPTRREIEAFSMLARRAPRTTVARIPVVVHVLYRTAADDIPDAQVASQIDVLNADFRATNADLQNTPAPFLARAGDALVEFALATEDPAGKPSHGITRTRTSHASFEGEIGDLDDAIKVASGARAWPADRYLNLWVCALGSGLLGYAQFPGGPADRDGVVILNTAFGTTGSVQAPFDLGRTATHEIGHWLNLLHIWGDDDLGCRGSDSVADTPNQAGSNAGCPQFPRVSCRNGPSGDMFMNFMDYTDDACMSLFSKGQVARMHAALAGPRASIAGPEGEEASERLVDVLEFRATAASQEMEQGERPTLVFDGVDWV
jgi:pregnancy-associated plasma protein-A